MGSWVRGFVRCFAGPFLGLVRLLVRWFSLVRWYVVFFGVRWCVGCLVRSLVRSLVRYLFVGLSIHRFVSLSVRFGSSA